MKSRIDLVIFDMAGTTVRDNHEVERCFRDAANQSGLHMTDEEILAVQGWSKLFVFETFWTRQLGSSHTDLSSQINRSYALFKEILEAHYLTHSVQPTEGCLQTFEALRNMNIGIALTTGFYRKVTNIILDRLNWHVGSLDDMDTSIEGCHIDVSIASDEVIKGRPAADMIFKAMNMMGVSDPKRVVNIGDTPSDLMAGINAGCLYSLGLVNGTHSREALERCENHGLLESLADLPAFLQHGERLSKQIG